MEGVWLESVYIWMESIPARTFLQKEMGACLERLVDSHILADIATTSYKNVPSHIYLTSVPYWNNI